MTAAIAVAVGVRAAIWAMPVPRRIRSVWAASQVRYVKASLPHDSAVHTESKPTRSASWASSTICGRGCAVQ